MKIKNYKLKIFESLPDRRQAGAAMLISVVFFLFISLAIISGLVTPSVREYKNTRVDLNSKKSYFLAESGSEDAYYRIKKNMPISFPETLSLNNGSAVTDVSIVGSNEKEILSTGNVYNHIRSVLKNITTTDGFSFNFAVQVGLGGLRMENDSDVIGNVYSNGPIRGDFWWGNSINGDGVSAGATGSMSRIRTTLSAYARTISNSRIGKDAHYYQIITNTSVGGTSYSGSADQPLIEMPIPDSLLDDWEAATTATEPINFPCPYIINSSVTMGPKKINCDVYIRGNNTVVTLIGAVWINGNLIIENNPRFKVDDSVGNKSVPIIVRSDIDPENRGTIDINNNPTFYGSVTNGVANPDSYVMLVSRNTGAEVGNDTKAITAGNNVTGNLLLYAPHGKIELSNNVILRAVTSYQLTLKNNVLVDYTVGLSQRLFSWGPGGKWRIKRWKEVIWHNF